MTTEILDTRFFWSNAGKVKTASDLKKLYIMRYDLEFSNDDDIDFRNERIANVNTAIQIIEEEKKYAKAEQKRMFADMYIPTPEILAKKSFSRVYSENQLEYLKKIFGSVYSIKNSPTTKVAANTTVFPKTIPNDTDPRDQKKVFAERRSLLFERSNKNADDAKKGWGKVLKDQTYETADYIKFINLESKTDTEQQVRIEKLATEVEQQFENFQKEAKKKSNAFLEKRVSDRFIAVAPVSNKSFEIIRQLKSQFPEFKQKAVIYLELLNKENNANELLNLTNEMVFETMKQNGANEQQLQSFNERIKMQFYFISKFTTFEDYFSEIGNTFFRRMMRHADYHSQEVKNFFDSIAENKQKEDTEDKERIIDLYSDIVINKAFNSIKDGDLHKFVSDVKKKTQMEMTEENIVRAKDDIIEQCKLDMYAFMKVSINLDPKLEKTQQVFIDFIETTFDKLKTGKHFYLFDDNIDTTNIGLSFAQKLFYWICTILLSLRVVSGFVADSNPLSCASDKHVPDAQPSKIIDDIDRIKGGISLAIILKNEEQNTKSFKMRVGTSKTVTANAFYDGKNEVLDDQYFKEMIGKIRKSQKNTDFKDYKNEVIELLTKNNGYITFLGQDIALRVSNPEKFFGNKNENQEIQNLFNEHITLANNVIKDMSNDRTTFDLLLEDWISDTAYVAEYFRNGMVYENFPYQNEASLYDGKVFGGKLVPFLKQVVENYESKAAALLANRLNLTETVGTSSSKMKWDKVIEKFGNSEGKVTKEELKVMIEENGDLSKRYKIAQETMDATKLKEFKEKETNRFKNKYFVVWTDSSVLFVHFEDRLFQLIGRWTQSKAFARDAFQSLDRMKIISEQATENSFKRRFTTTMSEDVLNFFKEVMLVAAKQLNVGYKTDKIITDEELRIRREVVIINELPAIISTYASTEPKYLNKNDAFFLAMKTFADSHDFKKDAWYMSYETQVGSFINSDLTAIQSAKGIVADMADLIGQNQMYSDKELSDKEADLEQSAKLFITAIENSDKNAEDIQDKIFLSGMTKQIQKETEQLLKSPSCRYTAAKIAKKKPAFVASNLQVGKTISSQYMQRDTIETLRDSKNTRGATNLLPPGSLGSKKTEKEKVEDFIEFGNQSSTEKTSNALLSWFGFGLCEWSGINSLVSNYANIIKNVHQIFSMGFSLGFGPLLSHGISIAASIANLTLVDWLSRRANVFLRAAKYGKNESDWNRFFLYVLGTYNIVPYHARVLKKMTGSRVKSIYTILATAAVAAVPIYIAEWILPLLPFIGLSPQIFDRTTKAVESILGGVGFGESMSSELSQYIVAIGGSVVVLGAWGVVFYLKSGKSDQDNPPSLIGSFLMEKNFIIGELDKPNPLSGHRFLRLLVSKLHFQMAVPDVENLYRGATPETWQTIRRNVDGYSYDLDTDIENNIQGLYSSTAKTLFGHLISMAVNYGFGQLIAPSINSIMYPMSDHYMPEIPGIARHTLMLDDMKVPILPTPTYFSSLYEYFNFVETETPQECAQLIYNLRKSSNITFNVNKLVKMGESTQILYEEGKSVFFETRDLIRAQRAIRPLYVNFMNSMKKVVEDQSSDSRFLDLYKLSKYYSIYAKEGSDALVRAFNQ